MKKLETDTAIDHILEVAKKLKLKVKYEITGVKDSELGDENHMWLEDINGKTKGSFFYWKKNDLINNSAGLSYTEMDTKYNISLKVVGDVKEIYKKYNVRMPRQKKNTTNKIVVDRFKEIHDKFIQLCSVLYYDTEWASIDGFIQREMDSPGYTERFIKFSESGFEEYWNRLERELFQLDVWDEKNIQEALFRVMDDYDYENIGGFTDMSEVAFTLSYYFTPLLRVLFRWSPDKIDEFWEFLGEH